MNFLNLAETLHYTCSVSINLIKMANQRMCMTLNRQQEQNAFNNSQYKVRTHLKHTQNTHVNTVAALYTSTRIIHTHT